VLTTINYDQLFIKNCSN